jgi:hypothetical protein
MRFCSAVCLLLALCTLALAPGAQAWWCTGHMLVASVAHQELTVAAQNYIKPLLLLIGDSYPMAQTFASTAVRVRVCLSVSRVLSKVFMSSRTYADTPTRTHTHKHMRVAVLGR